VTPKWEMFQHVSAQIIPAHSNEGLKSSHSSHSCCEK